MPDGNTTPPADGGNTEPQQDNWEARYRGLQKVLASRDTDLTTANAELDRLRKEGEQAQADLATYRQRDVEASEEEQARASYEALRTRFEEPTPKPVGNNAARPVRGWEDGTDTSWRGREHGGDSTGFPV